MVRAALITIVAVLDALRWFFMLLLGQTRKTVELYYDHRFYSGAPPMYD